MSKRKQKEQKKSPKPAKVLKTDEINENGSDSPERTREFVQEIKRWLRADETLLTGLTKLRNGLRWNDNGAALAQEFIRENSEIPEVFKVLEKGKQPHSQLEFQMALEVLEHILLFTSNNNSTSVGTYLVQRILRNHLKLIYSSLNPGGPSSLVKGALKLLVAMVTQGGSVAREVQSAFDFTLKALRTLPYKHDKKDHQDIRTCFIYFVMSFLMFGDDAVIRNVTSVKGFVSSIFKGLTGDSPTLVHLVISTLKQKVVDNSSIPKKTKVHLFSPVILTQLTKLYQYNVDEEGGEGEENEQIREAVHSLLQDVCCTFKHGICFANSMGLLSSRSNNPVLLRFLQSLPKTIQETNLQELVVKILVCCPDLVGPYLSGLSASYEPRLSLPWITNVSFLIKLYTALPTPASVLEKVGHQLSSPSPSSADHLVATAIPTGITRTNLSHGLQHTSVLVKDTTLALLVLMLERAASLVTCLDQCSADNVSQTTIDIGGEPVTPLSRASHVKNMPFPRDSNTMEEFLNNGGEPITSRSSESHVKMDTTSFSRDSSRDEHLPEVENRHFSRQIVGDSDTLAVISNFVPEVTPLPELVREAVLRALPDVKTVIALRQNLVQMSESDLAEGTGLDQGHDSSEGSVLSRKVSYSELLVHSLQAMLGYQSLSPLIFAGSGFDLGKLLSWQHGLDESLFTPQAQQLTLRILLESPPTAYRWYQQKTKSGPSSLYSILKVFVQTTSSEIKDLATQLVHKFLRSADLIDSESLEVSTWLRHLTTLVCSHDNNALLVFLDEICHSVAIEPYTYADVIAEVTSQAAARKADEAATGFLVTEGRSQPRLPFSPLVIRALLLHQQRVLKESEDGEPNKNSSLCLVARYLNLVVLDMLWRMTDPLPLCLVVQRYYGNLMTSKSCAPLATVHRSLLEHVYYWSGEECDVYKGEEPSTLPVLQAFLQKEGSVDELYRLVSSLDKLAFVQMLPSCVRYCVDHLAGDLTPLVQCLMVTPHRIIDSSNIADMIPLLKALPLESLLWQALSLNSSAPTKAPKTRRKSTPKKVKEINSPLNAMELTEVRQIVLQSLANNDTSCYARCTQQVLQHLELFVNRIIVCKRPTRQENIESIISSAFELIQVMLERNFKIGGEPGEVVNNSLHENMEIESHRAKNNGNNGQEAEQPESRPVFCASPAAKGSSFIESSSANPSTQTLLCCLKHPLLLSCFLTNQTGNRSITKTVSSCITDSVIKVLRTARDRLPLEKAMVVMAPYMQKLCDTAIRELQQDGEVSPGRALSLLQEFRAFCPKNKISAVVTKLLELPLDVLVTQTSEGLEPTLYCRALISVLTGDLEWANQRAVLTTCFERLLDLVKSVTVSDLDGIVSKLLRNKPELGLLFTPSLLDCCLDNPTCNRVAIATLLVRTNPSLRAHLERRCYAWKEKEKWDVKPLKKKHRLKFVSLVTGYLCSVKEGGPCVRGVTEVLLEVYLPSIWQWLHDNENQHHRDQDEWIAMLKAFINLNSIRANVMLDNLTQLLNITASRPWNHQQMCAAYELLKGVQTGDVLSYPLVINRMVFAFMENISQLLTAEEDDDGLTSEAISKLVTLLKETKVESLTIHVASAKIWKVFVKELLRRKFHNYDALRIIHLCVKLMYNSSVNEDIPDEMVPLATLYRLILSHSNFLEVMLSEGTEEHTDRLKCAVLDILVCILELCPACCDSSHLTVLFAAYKASLSKTDQRLLYLLHLYEKSKVPLHGYRPYVWGQAALEHHKNRKSQPGTLWQQPSTSEVLELLDVQQMIRSAVDFPINRELQPKVQDSLNTRESEKSRVYDPCFFISLFSHILAPHSEIDCRKFIDRGGLGLTVAALSSRDERMRQAAGHVLSRCLMHVEAARFRERKQVQLLLECLRDGISEPTTRVSSVITRFVARAAHVLLRPEHSMYILINSFLLSRPAIDPREIPMFYTLFNSSSLQHWNERTWMLQLMFEGLRDSQDYYVYKKRHAIELALTFYDSQICDQQSRPLVTNLLSAALSVHAAAFDLSMNYGLVAWLHSLAQQSKHSSNNEGLNTCLHLLHTLWTTVQEGTQSACAEGDDVETRTPHPPNLACECLLVCRTLLQSYRSISTSKDTGILLSLLHSVLAHLGHVRPQESHLSLDDALCAVYLWCSTFNEQALLTRLLRETEPSLDSMRDWSSPDNVDNTEGAKLSSLIELLNVLCYCRAGPDPSQSHHTLFAFAFALHFVDACAEHLDLPLALRIVQWLRQVISHDVISSVLSARGDYCINQLMRMYNLDMDVTTGSPPHASIPRQRVIAELNGLFSELVLYVNERREDVSFGPTVRSVVNVTSRDVYTSVVTSGLLEAARSTATNLSQGLTSLLSVLMQELWMRRETPNHFMTLLRYNSGNGNDTAVFRR